MTTYQEYQSLVNEHQEAAQIVQNPECMLLSSKQEYGFSYDEVRMKPAWVDELSETA